VSARRRPDEKLPRRAFWAFHRALKGHRTPREKETADGELTVVRDEGEAIEDTPTSHI